MGLAVLSVRVIIIAGLLRLCCFFGFVFLKLTMFIIKTMTIIANHVINIFISIVTMFHNLTVSLLDLSDLPLVFENLALLFPQELLLFPLKFPLHFLFMRVEIGPYLK